MLIKSSIVVTGGRPGPWRVPLIHIPRGSPIRLPDESGPKPLALSVGKTGARGTGRTLPPQPNRFGGQDERFRRCASAAYPESADLSNEPWAQTPAPATLPEGGAHGRVELEVGVRDGRSAVVLRGDLDVAGAADAGAAIAALVRRGQALVLDMSVLDLLDCSAAGALRRAQALARRGGGDVVLAGPRPLVRRLLALTGNDEVFCIQASVEAAVAGMASRRRRYSWRRLAVRAARPGRAGPPGIGGRRVCGRGQLG
jgi:anti-sigma B factor antagonist